jgi:hypothetical protein
MLAAGSEGVRTSGEEAPMEFLSQLWVPILVSTVAVFIASCVIHMAIPIHKADYRGVPEEGPLLDALRPLNIAPGEYYFPWCADMKAMRSPEFLQKRMQGPVGILTVLPAGPPGMTKYLVQWVLFTLVIAVFVAYIGAHALDPGAAFGEVLRVTGTAAMLAFAPAYAHSAIWKGLSWSTALKFVFDGIVYGLVMGAVFGWLWPAAA